MGYLNELLALAAMLPKGGVFHAVVQHDNGCPALTGGDCNCSPEIEVLTDKQFNDGGNKND